MHDNENQVHANTYFSPVPLRYERLSYVHFDYYLDQETGSSILQEIRGFQPAGITNW